MSTIAVMGATGHTGSQIARQLVRRGISPVLIGRNASRLGEIAANLERTCPIRIADATRPETLDSVLGDIDVVINTIGPFMELGEPVVQAAIQKGAHYLDTTGEQTFMEHVRVAYDGPARNAGCTIIPAFAFEYALGTSAAAIGLASLDGRADRVETFYRTSGNSISHGTAQSIARVIGKPMKSWSEGRLVAEPIAAVTTEILFPGEEKYRLAASFGGGIALAAAELGSVGQARSFMVVSEDMVTWMRRARGLKPLAGNRWIQRLSDTLIRRFMKKPQAGDDNDARFEVAARVSRGASSTVVSVKGAGPYAITAAIAADGAIRLAGDNAVPSGVISPPRAFAPEALLDALASEGVSWEQVRYGH